MIANGTDVRSADAPSIRNRRKREASGARQAWAWRVDGPSRHAIGHDNREVDNAVEP
jgi:hypothetical protein